MYYVFDLIPAEVNALQIVYCFITFSSTVDRVSSIPLPKKYTSFESQFSIPIFFPSDTSGSITFLNIVLCRQLSFFAVWINTLMVLVKDSIQVC